MNARTSISQIVLFTMIIVLSTSCGSNHANPTIDSASQVQSLETPFGTISKMVINGAKVNPGRLTANVNVTMIMSNRPAQNALMFISKNNVTYQMVGGSGILSRNLGRVYILTDREQIKMLHDSLAASPQGKGTVKFAVDFLTAQLNSGIAVNSGNIDSAAVELKQKEMKGEIDRTNYLVELQKLLNSGKITQEYFASERERILQET